MGVLLAWGPVTFLLCLFLVGACAVLPPQYWVYDRSARSLFDNVTMTLPSSARTLNPALNGVINEKFRTHSNNIDVYVLLFFKDKSGGYFVDMGAAEWRDPSTSYVVEYFNRWSGICYSYDQSYLMGLLANRMCKTYMEGTLSSRNESIHHMLDHAEAPPVIDFLSIAKHPEFDRADIDTLRALDLNAYTFQIIYIEAPTSAGYHFLYHHDYRLLLEMGGFGSFYVHKSKPNFAELMLQYHKPDPPAWLKNDPSAQNHTVAHAFKFVEHFNHSVVPANVSIRTLPSVLYSTSLYVSPVDQRSALVYSMNDLWSDGFGNAVGFLLEAIGCARASKADFYWTIDVEPNRPQATELERFFGLWPTFLENPENERDGITSLVLAKHRCSCFYYCWEYAHAAWIHAHHFVAHLWHHTMKMYVEDLVARTVANGSATSRDDYFPMSFFDANLSSMPVSTTQKPPERFPLIPDVVLHFRCSDIITNKDAAQTKIHTHYGFLNFHEYASRIPSTARTVYVLSDPPDRGSDGVLCHGILSAFVRFLRGHVPATTAILVKRGGEIMFAQAQITLARVTVCSASTFCFWSALASHGTVYFPPTKLVYEGKEPPLSDGFHWMSGVKLHHFGAADSLQSIEQALTSPVDV